MTNNEQHIPEDRLNIKKLLEPIQGENPCGDSLRYDGTYDKIEDARRQDDPNESRGEWISELKKADWDSVKELCLNALNYRTKDLHIAIRLMESLLHTHEFAGVSDGLQLILGLCEKYWDCLYEISDDDTECRLAPIVWTDNTLYLKLKLIPITKPASADILSYSYADKDKADIIEELARKEKKLPEGNITRALFDKSIALTPTAFYEALSEHLNDSLLCIKQSDALIEEKCGKDAPSLRQFRTVLERIQDVVKDILKKREILSPEDIAVVPSQQTDYHSINSREEAYRLLNEIGEYLCKREPHSPVPLLIKRAVVWGNMSVTELLEDLVRNKDELTEIFKLFGKKSEDS